MATINRKAVLNFQTDGASAVHAEIKALDAELKSMEKGGGGAAAAIGNLSESLDKGLENSVGRAFKATDRLNSIVGQVTGAIGLATLAVGAGVAAYKALTGASNAVGAGHGMMTVQLKSAQEAFERGAKAADEMRKAEERLAAAVGVRLALIDPSVRAQFQANEQTVKNATTAVGAIRSTISAQQAQRADLLKTIATQEKALQQAARAGNVVASQVQARADALTASRAQLDALDQSIAQNELLVGSQQAAIRTADAWTKGIIGQAKAAEGLAAATGGSGSGAQPSIKTANEAAALSFAPVLNAARALTAEARALASAIGPELEAAYASSLGGLADALSAEGVPTLADALGFGPEAQADLLKIPEVAQQAASASQAALNSAASIGDAAAASLGNAAAAALVYGESLDVVAAQAIAGIAAQATSEAAFQAAKALAFAAAGLFTGNPAALAAASQAAASAAAFGAIAAVTVPASRATGSASGGAGGGGVPAGPSAREAGIGGGGQGGGGGDTIILNVGQPVSTEADIGAAVGRALNANGRRRGSVRVNRRALRRG